MADISGMSPEELGQVIARAVTDALSAKGGTAAAPINTKDIDVLMARLAKLDKKISQTDTSMGSLVKSMLIGKKSTDAFDYELRELTEQIEVLAEKTDEANVKKIQELEQRRIEIEGIRRRIEVNSLLVDSVKQLGAISLQGVSSAAKFTRGLQDNASVFGQMETLASGAISMAGTGVQGFAQATGAAGSMLSNSTNPKLKFLGTAAQVAGTGISIFGKAAESTGQFVASFLIKEMEKTVESFQKSTASGALFGDGLTGLRNAANDAGLTVKQFGSIVSNNSATLAETGLSVGEAAKKMGQVGKIMRQTNLSDELLKLGYSFEEQAGLTAEVMADFRKAGTLNKTSNAEVAKSTADYATNLRVISAITGEDAKKKLEESRAATAQVAFRAKLQELEQKQPGITRKVMDAMATMPKIQREAVMQMTTLGAVTNKNAAVMMSQSGGFSSSITNFVGMLNSGSFSVEEYEKAQGKAADQFREDVPKFLAIGTAGIAGGLPELNSAISEMVLYTDKVSEQGFKDARAAAEEQKRTQDSMTQGYVAAATSAQNMANRLEAIVTKDLGRFSELAGSVFSSIEEAINKFHASLGEKSIYDKIKDSLSSLGSIALDLVGFATLIPTAIAGAKKLLPKIGLGSAAESTGKVLAKEGGETATKAIGKTLAKEGGETATKAIEKTLIKEAGEATAKTAGKSLIKKIPLIGLGAGALFGIQRLLEGDVTGAGMELASGAAGTLPGVGTAASLGIDAALLARDITKSMGETTATGEGMVPGATPTSATSATQTNLLPNYQPVIDTAKTTPTTDTAQQPTTQVPTAALIEELKTAIQQLAKQAPENTDLTKKMLATLENMRDNSNTQLQTHEQMLRSIQDQKDIAERMLHNSY